MNDGSTRMTPVEPERDWQPWADVSRVTHPWRDGCRMVYNGLCLKLITWVLYVHIVTTFRRSYLKKYKVATMELLHLWMASLLLPPLLLLRRSIIWKWGLEIPCGCVRATISCKGCKVGFVLLPWLQTVFVGIPLRTCVVDKVLTACFFLWKLRTPSSHG
jgi:hypothetical protein